MNVRGRFTRRTLLEATGAVAVLSATPLAARLADAARHRGMNIGIIGSGHVGGALGRVWAGAGNEVMFSSRDLDHDRRLAAEIGANARAGTPREAAAFGRVVLFAVPYSAFPELVASLGRTLEGKVVINASNPFPQRDGEIAVRALKTGVGVFDAQLLRGAFVVRAFNAVPAAVMASAHAAPGQIGMPIAGDKRAIDIVAPLIREAGFEPVIVGGLGRARYLIPGTPLAGVHTPDEVRRIATTLKR